MAVAFKLSGEPNLDDVQGFVGGNGAFAEGQDIGIVMGPIPNGDLFVPA